MLSVKIPTIAASAIAFMALAAPARAALIDWTTWSTTFTTDSVAGSATGTAGSVGVTYSGELQDLLHGYPSWAPSGTFSGGTVGNPPDSSGGIVKLFGGSPTTTDTITFATEVTNPVIAIWSLGQGGIVASFDFTDQFTIEFGGKSNEYQGSSIYSMGNDVLGAEGNGTIMFSGKVKSITWTNPTYENWYGFTVGVSAVPETSTWLMMLLGFAGLGFAGYRSSRKASNLAA